MAAHNSLSRVAVIVAIVLCICEAIKLTVFCQAGPAFRASDSGHYWGLGEQVASGDIWMIRNPVAFRTPGYPWFLGMIRHLCGDRAWWVSVASQYVAVFMTTVITGWWTWKLTRRAWLGVLALAVCILSGARASYASAFMTETLFTLFLTSFVMLMSAKRFSFKQIVIAAFVWGLAWLVRPVAVVLAPMWLFSCWFSEDDRATQLRTRLEKLVITIIVLSVLLTPWVIRNRYVFRRTTLTVFLGRELWMSTFGPGQPAAASLPDTPESRRLQELVLKNGPFADWGGNWEVCIRLTGSGLTDVEADELMRLVSQQAISQFKLRFLVRWAVRFIDFWRQVYSRPMAFWETTREYERLPDRPGENWRWPECQRYRDIWLNNAPESRLITIELSSLVAMVGLVGLLLNPWTWRVGAIVTLAILCLAILTSMVEYPSYRYRMVLEPIMIVVTLAGWTNLVDVITRGKRALWQEYLSAQFNEAAG